MSLPLTGERTVPGNLVAMPFGDATFDAVVSMQTVEHPWDQAAFLADLVASITSDDFVINDDVDRCLELYFVAVRT